MVFPRKVIFTKLAWHVLKAINNDHLNKIIILIKTRCNFFLVCLFLVFCFVSCFVLFCFFFLTRGCSIFCDPNTLISSGPKESFIWIWILGHVEVVKILRFKTSQTNYGDFPRTCFSWQSLYSCFVSAAKNYRNLKKKGIRNELWNYSEKSIWNDVFVSAKRLEVWSVLI